MRSLLERSLVLQGRDRGGPGGAARRGSALTLTGRSDSGLLNEEPLLACRGPCYLLKPVTPSLVGILGPSGAQGLVCEGLSEQPGRVPLAGGQSGRAAQGRREKWGSLHRAVPRRRRLG